MTSALIPTLGTVQQISQISPLNFKTDSNMRDFQATPELTKMSEEQPNQMKGDASSLWSIFSMGCCAVLRLPCSGSSKREIK